MFKGRKKLPAPRLCSILKVAAEFGNAKAQLERDTTTFT